jgi:GrpB-like predicted nucleotidyltransferase (UPF0157 family)
MAVLLEDYSPQWKQQFEQLTEVYRQHLDGLVLGIEHVWSTAVPGPCAKPVIDIDIVVESIAQVEEVYAAIAYARLKRSLSQTARNMDEYVMGKTSFIIRILAAGGMSTDEILLIENQN